MEKKNRDNEFIHLLDDISFEPIFIMGLHRSGTSILYKMLGATGHFNTVSAYHILEYDNLLCYYTSKEEDKVRKNLSQLFKDKGISNRRIDHLPITPDFEQEYVYLFREKKQGNILKLKNLTLFENLCKKIVYTSEKNKPILLKNPDDFPNFLFIKEKFPNARFIFIHRDPIEVISSTMHAWHILIKEKNPYTALFSKTYDELFYNPFLLLAIKIYFSSFIPLALVGLINKSYNATKYYLDNINYLSKNSYLSIKYIDLCKKPNVIMTNILDFLKLNTKIDFEDFIKPRKLNIAPEVKRMQKYILKKMINYNKEFGFNK